MYDRDDDRGDWLYECEKDRRLDELLDELEEHQRTWKEAHTNA